MLLKHYLFRYEYLTIHENNAEKKTCIRTLLLEKRNKGERWKGRNTHEFRYYYISFTNKKCVRRLVENKTIKSF